MSQNELLSCPFCGEPARISHSEDLDGCYWAKVRCDGCGVETRGKWASNRSSACPIFYTEVREEWNHRIEAAQAVAPGGGEVAINVRHPKCHEAAHAFWNYWNANGETHRHGYYESTWGAINQALRMVGVVPYDYQLTRPTDGRCSLGPEHLPPTPRANCVWPNCACDQPSKKCGEDLP